MFSEYYHSLMKLNADELYKGLLAYGLFSEKLPPIFTSKSFYYYSLSPYFVLGIEKKRNDLATGALKSVKGSKGYITFDSIRNNHVPRSFGIPNPFKYNELCYFLKCSWEKELLDHFRVCTSILKHKVSRIHVRKIKDKNKIFEMKYEKTYIKEKLKTKLLFGNKYIVKTDITNCFHSIYSHAIPWALVGKNEAKSDTSNKLWYNALDLFVRNTKHGETCGVLIGPVASQLISEIILVRIDEAMYKKGYRYIRNIDDYECYVESHDKALQFVQDLSEELKKYNLDINPKKTTIEKLPVMHLKKWIYEIILINNSISKSFSYKDIISYIDKVIDLFKECDDAAIFTYMIKSVASSICIKSPSATEYYVKRILNLVILYPYLIHIVDEYIFKRYKVSNDIIKSFCDELYDDSKLKDNFEGMTFALYFAIKYEFKIENYYFEIEMNRIINFPDFMVHYSDKEKCIHENRVEINNNHCIYLLFNYLYTKKYSSLFNPSKISDFENLALKLIETGDMDNYWLYIYEVLSKDKLEFKKNQFIANKKSIEGDEESKKINKTLLNDLSQNIEDINMWINLKDNNISFIENSFRKLIWP